MVVERTTDSQVERNYPGRVFEDENLSYTEAMLSYVQASQPYSSAFEGVAQAESDEMVSALVQKRSLRQEETQLRFERRILRQRRAEEDAAWRILRAERKLKKAAQASQEKQDRIAQEKQWKTLCQQRKVNLAQRKQEDRLWREKRCSLRKRLLQLPLTVWFAILVITDNCTRQCLGLPLFAAGAKVTAEMIVSALKELLPPELHFLITDRGPHFRAKVFEQLQESFEFIHVLIARHRPQSNGIAERFIRTLKEWLRGKEWQDELKLSQLLSQFEVFYNDRPHQGFALNGLSPNEFAKRLGAVNSTSQLKLNCQLSS